MSIPQKFLLANRHVSVSIGFYSIQGVTAITKHGVTRKRGTKRKKHIRQLFRKWSKIIGAYIISRLKAIWIIRQRKIFRVFHNLDILEKKPLA